MSQKISAMPSVANVNNADELPVVQGGVNMKATRDQYLKTAGGEIITIAYGPSEVQFSDAGFFLGSFDNAHGFDFVLANGNHIGMNAAIGIQLDASGSGIIQLAVGAGVIQITAAGAITIAPAVGQVLQLTYTPAVPANWVGGVGTVWNALDRLSAAIVARTIGGAIP
jgi:hypothetical protein